MTDDAADERGRPDTGDDALPGSAPPTSVDLRTFQHAVEQSLSIVVLTDANGRIQYVNPKFTEVTGYARDETIGRRIEDLGALPPEEQARLWETVLAGGHWQGEIENRTRGGESYWVFTSVSPVRSDAGVTTHFLGLGVDITQHKRAEEALRRNEEHFRSLIEDGSDVIVELDNTGAIRYVSPSVRRVFDYDPEELMGLTVFDFVHPHDLPAVLQSFRRTVYGPNLDISIEYRVRRKDGSWRTVESMSRPLADGSAIVVNCRDISERKQAEEALRDSEAKFRALAETSSAIISIIQGEKMVYVNPATEAIGGYTQEELLARPFWETLHPDWQEETRQRALARQRGEDVPTRAETKIITKSGEERWLELTAGVTEYGGQPAVLATAFDITDRKRAEEALRHSEERYRILYRENPSMYFTVDAQGTVLSVNQFGAEQLGYTAEELVGQSVLDVFHEADKDSVRVQLQACLERPGEVADWEFRKVHRSGRTIWVKEAARATRDAEGNTIVLIVCEDITERKLAEEAVLASEEHYRSLLDNYPDGVSVLRDGRITYVNPALCAMSGNSPEEILDRAPEEFIVPRDRERATQRIRELAKGAPASPSEYEILRADGSTVPVEIMSRAITYEGKPALLSVLRDITERRRSEEALRDSETRLRAFATAVPDVSFILDEEGRYVEVLAQPQTESLLFANAEELKGRLLHDVLPKRSADLFLSVIRKTIETEEPQTLEYALTVRAGRHWFEARTAPLPLAGGPRMVVWVARDITQRKRMEEALQTLREELESKAELAAEQGRRFDLSFRELTILHLVVSGRSDREISVILGIRPMTVSKHVGNILKKMGASSRTAAGVSAWREGLIN